MKFNFEKNKIKSNLLNFLFFASNAERDQKDKIKLQNLYLVVHKKAVKKLKKKVSMQKSLLFFVSLSSVI